MPRLDGDFATAVEIRRHHGERNGKLLEAQRHSERQEGGDDALGIELAEPEAAVGAKFGQRRRPRAPERAEDVTARREHGEDVVLDRAGRQAARRARADDRPDRGARDPVRAKAQVLERRQDMEMREPPRPAAAEREADPGPGRRTAALGGGRSLSERDKEAPQAPAGPTVMIVGSTDMRRLATAFTSSSVTASIRPWRFSM